MPMTVRNNEGNATAFTKTLNGDPIKIIWGTKGQPNDTQRVPDGFADDIDFLNALDQGVLTVVGGPPEILEKIEAQTSEAHAFREQQMERLRNSSESVMNRSQDKDMIGATCIGPGFRPGQVCQRPVLVASKQIDEIPPLCEEHQGLAMSFHLVESGSKGENATESRDGVVRREWKQATITAPQRDLTVS